MNNRRLYSIIQGARNTEKSVTAAEKHKQIIFQVKKDATKTEVKQAVEKIFKVGVAAVRVWNMKGKTKKFKQTIGVRSDWKKASVSLKDGYDINLAEFE